MMDAPELRIGWLKMFLRVLGGTGGSATYAELIAFCERNLESARAEVAAAAGQRPGAAERSQPQAPGAGPAQEGAHVRQRT